MQVQFELPSDELEPGEQSRHADVPFNVEYVPAAHALHAADPVDALNHPATHGVHVPALRPEEPALHLQAANAGLPVDELAFAGHVRHAEIARAPTAAEYVPAEQLLHTTDPAEFLYVPATHAVHASPSGPE